MSVSNYENIYKKYQKYSMIQHEVFIGNLMLAGQAKGIKGSIVECGVWRGGMIAGIAELMGNNRNYLLLDSFEGLPSAKEIDGPAANAWQNDKNSPLYLDNCRSEISFAEKAMQMSGAVNYRIIKGWFSESLKGCTLNEPIAILRLDCDWYDSMNDCLNPLYPMVSKGGIIIIDDYYVWDGCSRALHDYLSVHKLTVRIRQTKEGICYLIKD